MAKIKIADSVLNDIKLVIFDKDGTIIDLHKYWAFVIKERGKHFSSFFQDDLRDKIYDQLTKSMGLESEFKVKNQGPVGLESRSFIINTVFNILKIYNNKIEVKDVENGFKSVDSSLYKHYDEILQKLIGVDCLLKELKKIGCLIIVATTDISSRAIAGFEFLNINNYFDFVIGSDMVQKSKPDTEMLDKIFEKYTKIKKQEVVLIGDSMSDLGMAENANVSFIGVNTGLHSDEFIGKSKILANNLAEIKVYSK